MIDLASIFSDPTPADRSEPSASKPAVADPIDAQPPGNYPPDYFDPANWERRQDAAGRWGWEWRHTPEAERWWHRCDFEQLPEPIKL